MKGHSASNAAESIHGTAGVSLLESLRDARAYPHDTAPIEVLETHVSWVVLTGPFAYKIKKPVRLPFLDFSSLETRHRFCDEELRLNRRLAPDLYLDVVPIGYDGDGVRVGALPAVEYAVRMHQFAQSERLDRMILARRAGTADLDALGRRLAVFHGSLPESDPNSEFGSVTTIGDHIAENFITLAQHLDRRDASGAELIELRTASETLLQRRSKAITERKQLGAVRECHGDLHTRNVVAWDGKLLPYDCLEFDVSMRTTDVIDEAAFLMMDLLSMRRIDLAYAFLNAYLEESGDYDGIEVLRLYLIYRCFVRAKVEALLDAQRLDKDPASYASLTARYLRLGRALLLDRDRPWIIAMHGLSGSGKSWLADRLSVAFPAIRVRSDIERKRLQGLGAQAASGSGTATGIYSAEHTQQTYRRLLSIAQLCVAEHFNVIIDAACLKAEQRMAFADLAYNSGVNFALVECSADSQLLRQRLAGRAKIGSVSEADEAVLDYQLETREALTATERERTVTFRSGEEQGVEQIAERIRNLEAT